MTISPKADSIVDVLLSLEGCTRYGARFLARSGHESFYPYKDVLHRAKWVAGTLQAGGLKAGDRVAVILPTAVSFLDVFLGAQLAGAVPAALYPPVRLGKLKEYVTKTRRMLSKIGARYLVTDGQIKNLLGPVVEKVGTLEKILDAQKLVTPSPWRPVDVDPAAPAFLQFSSGTTVEPKAVMISHTNLLHNLEMMDTFFRILSDREAAQGAVCWLPLYHDMGLVGCLFMGLYHPGTVTYIGPEMFIAKPRLWLQTLSRYKAVVSPAPDFAYGLCLTKVKDSHMEDVDLSNWKIAFNGAEPIDVQGMAEFCERFSRWGFPPEAMTPVYGLAEAGLAVTFSDFRTQALVTEFDRESLSRHGKARPGEGRALPSVGRPMSGLEVDIRGEDDKPLPQETVGKIVVRGPTITSGYFNDPEATAQAIRRGWLDTGDLGFLYEGDLYISGRAKDLIIVRGRNYAPQEVEELIDGAEGLRKGCAVAVGHFTEDDREQLFVLAEKDIRSERPDEDIAGEIKERIVAGISLVPHHIEILQPGTLPRTSSGKMRRADALRMFLSGELGPPDKVGLLKMAKEIGKSHVALGKFWMRRQFGGD
jgi:acyl-CoA synthetase (AMP-forming)/AMP-acid ligase II